MCKAYMQIADGFKMIAAGYEALAKAGVDVVKEEDAKKEAVEKAAAVIEEPVSETMEQESVPIPTIEDIRAIMRAKNKEGKLDKCQAVLREFGAVKLSDIPKENYAELMAKVEVL